MGRKTRYLLSATLAAALLLAVCLIAVAQGNGLGQRGAAGGPYVPADAPPGADLSAPASVRAAAGEKVNVLIEMDAPPLAEVYIAEKAKGASKVDEKLQADKVAALKAAQAPVAAEASKHGKVLFSLTNFVNGVGVTNVDTRDLDALRKLPGVKAVHVMSTYKYDLGQSVPFIGGQQVIDESGLDGRGTRIAVIDTGIDYTHRDFGGPGTVDAYNFATADPTKLPGPYNGVTLFPTQKVVGGYDFVGDAWTGANPGEGITETLDLAPDPNPIDLVGPGPGGVEYTGGHGTHTSGIAAGFGVPNSSVNGSIPSSFIHPTDAYTVFHGVAPAAQLYQYKVCSSLVNNCDGLAMIAAFDRAADPNGDGNMNDHVDSINMSIGSLFAADVSSEDAANRAVRAGIAVAISAGNSSDVPFILGAPSTAERALSVAASTANKPVYGLRVTAPTTATNMTIPFVWQPWSGPLTPSTSGPLIEARTVVTMTAATAKLGCTQPGGVNPFPAGSLAGKIAVIDRGTCAGSEKGLNAQHAGAIAAIIVSQSNNPPAALSLGGTAPTIPVLLIAYQNGQALYGMLRAHQTVNVTIGENQIGTLGDVLAGFTSRGPSRFGNPKPDISAPGFDIVSAAAGTGTGGVSESGTSMAAPHIAGSLALMKQAHPNWSPTELEAVLVNTSKPELYSYQFVTAPPGTRAPISLAGAGRVDLVAASHADSVVLGDLLAHVGYGVQAIPYTFTATKPITVENKSGATKTYDLSTTFEVTQPLPSGVTVNVSPSTLTVPAGGAASANVTISLDPQFLAQWRLTPGQQGLGASLTKVEVAGFVWAREQGSGQQYHVPFYVLPRSASDIDANTNALTLTGFGASNPASFTLTNRAYYTGTADIFHLMVVDPKDVPSNVVTATERLDIQYVGARWVTSASVTDVTTNSVEFGIKTYAPRMLPIEAEFDVNIDMNGDGKADYVVFNVDQGSLGGACCNGNNVVAVYNVATKKITGPYNYTDTNVWSSNLIMRVPASAIGLATPKKFNFWVEAYWNYPGYTTFEEENAGAPLLDRAPDNGSVAFNPATVRFNPVNPANGQLSYRIPVAQGTARTINVYANLAGWLNASPSENGELGMLVLYRDNVPPGRDADVVQTSFPFQFTAFQQTINIEADTSGYVTSRPFLGDMGRNFGSSDMWTGESTQSERKYLGIASFVLPSSLARNSTITDGSLKLTLGDTSFLDSSTLDAEFGVRYADGGDMLRQTYYSLSPLNLGGATPVLDDDELKGKTGTTYTFTLDANTMRAMQSATTSADRRVSFLTYGHITGGYGRALINWQGVRSPNPPTLTITGFTCTGGTCP